MAYVRGRGGRRGGWIGGEGREEGTCEGTADGQNVKDTLLALAIATPLYAGAMHLLGAPAYTWARTLLVSLHLAFLTVWVPIYVFGFPSLYDAGIAERYRLTRLFSQWSPETRLEVLILYPVVGAVVGAWLGAIPMALDWDRPWQAWPLSVLVLSTAGFIVGGYAGWASCALKGLKQDIADEQRREKSAAVKPKASGGARRRKPGK